MTNKKPTIQSTELIRTSQSWDGQEGLPLTVQHSEIPLD